MRIRSLSLLLCVAATELSAQSRARPIELRRGMVITASVRVVPGTYRLRATSAADSGLIVIRGNDIVVDVWRGHARGHRPGCTA